MRILKYLIGMASLVWYFAPISLAGEEPPTTVRSHATTAPAGKMDNTEIIFEKDLGHEMRFRVEKRQAMIPPPPIVVNNSGPLLATSGFLYTFTVVPAHGTEREVLRLGPTDYFEVNVYDAAVVQNTIVVIYHTGPSTFARAIDLGQGANKLTESLIEAAHDYGALSIVTVGGKVLESASQDDIAIAIQKDTGGPRPVSNYFHVIRGKSSFVWGPTDEPKSPATLPAASSGKK